ncbi:MAG: hypothetical protein WD768_19390 [Phycisphaeraceae bacterium]
MSSDQLRTKRGSLVVTLFLIVAAGGIIIWFNSTSKTSAPLFSSGLVEQIELPSAIEYLKSDWSGDAGFVDFQKDGDGNIHLRVMVACRTAASWAATESELTARMKTLQVTHPSRKRMLNGREWTIVEIKAGMPRWHVYCKRDADVVYMMASEVFDEGAIELMLATLRTTECAN